MSFVPRKEYSFKVAKIIAMTPVSLQPTFLVFTAFFDSVKWPYYQKYVNQITKSHNSLKLVFTNTGGLGSNFVGFQFSLESNSLDICVLCEANYEDSVVSRNFVWFMFL